MEAANPQRDPIVPQRHEPFEAVHASREDDGNCAERRWMLQKAEVVTISVLRALSKQSARSLPSSSSLKSIGLSSSRIRPVRTTAVPTGPNVVGTQQCAVLPEVGTTNQHKKRRNRTNYTRNNVSDLQACANLTVGEDADIFRRALRLLFVAFEQAGLDVPYKERCLRINGYCQKKRRDDGRSSNVSIDIGNRGSYH
ncbi:hypothetical protein CC80DRAFT_265392 [Byssothecium circinans]|uniref:Uncharacterized protein n=1 Tax=Byssothecium circinans TaxID=147558 RepID=A0A6A5UD45_9PLEO|nr:hypothetical protein CC80DRAFT_265392 [Byssothecium circinans]